MIFPFFNKNYQISPDFTATLGSDSVYIGKFRRFLTDKIRYIYLRTKLSFYIFFILSSLIFVIIGKIVFINQMFPDLQGADWLLDIYGTTVTSVIFIIFFVTFTKYKDPYREIKKKRGEKTKGKYTVSLMVAVKDEENIIARCLDSMINQTYEKKEIIVVNDASTDRTPQILDEYAQKYNIKVIHLEKNVGKKRALAQAMLKAKGEIFAFTDSDSILFPDAVEKIVRIFEEDEKVGAVSGHARPLNADKNLITKIQDSWYEGQFSVRKAFESVFGAVTCVSGPLAVFRKEAVYNYIPAWENDTFLGQEFKFATDRTMTGFVLGCRYVGKKLKKRYANSPFVKSVDYPPRDWKIVYCKSARVYTNVPDTLKKFIRQQVRWKKSFIRNTFFTGSFFWRKHPVIASYYYLHILFVIVGPFIVFRHLFYLPLAEGIMYAAFEYLLGIIYIGFLFSIAFKIEDPESNKWIYRPLMNIISTFILSWLIFYSAATIKKMIWHRG